MVRYNIFETETTICSQAGGKQRTDFLNMLSLQADLITSLGNLFVSQSTVFKLSWKFSF